MKEDFNETVPTVYSLLFIGTFMSVTSGILYFWLAVIASLVFFILSLELIKIIIKHFM